MRLSAFVAAALLVVALAPCNAADDGPGRWILVRCEEWSNRQPAWPGHARRISLPDGARSTQCTYVSTNPDAEFTSTHGWSRPARVYRDDQPFQCTLSTTVAGRHLDPKKGPVGARHHAVYNVGEGTPGINSFIDVDATSTGPPQATRRTFDRRFHRLFGRDPRVADNVLNFLRAVGGDADPNMATEMGVTWWYQWVPGASDPPGGEAVPEACLAYPAQAAPLDLSGDWDTGLRWTFKPAGVGRFDLDIQAAGGEAAETGTAEVLSPYSFRVRYKRPQEQDQEARDYVLWLTPNRRCGAGAIRSAEDATKGAILAFKGYTILSRRPEADQPEWARNRIPHGFPPLVTGGVAGPGASPAPPASGPGVTIEALIDGRSELHVTPRGLYWVNLAFAKPGRNKGQRAPTRVNGVDWQPAWAGEDDGGEDRSEPYALNLGTLELGVVTATTNRSPVTILRTDQELVIRFDDQQPDDAWYTIRLVPAGGP